MTERSSVQSFLQGASLMRLEHLATGYWIGQIRKYQTKSQIFLTIFYHSSNELYPLFPIICVIFFFHAPFGKNRIIHGKCKLWKLLITFQEKRHLRLSIRKRDATEL